MPQREDIAELVDMIDQLEGLLERSSLSELEVEVGDTTVTLRSPQALLPVAGGIVAAGVGATEQPPIDAPIEDVPQERSGHRVLAPLTGVFYLSPSPEAEPYVHEGAQVNTGQVIGLIEAMKLFNEIKSDVTGTVRRITASDGDLVKAKEPLIEVDPA